MSRRPDRPNQCSRREFLAYGSIFGWIPFLRPKHISMAGARFRITRNGRSKHRYLVIHGNEETARDVLTRHIQANEGIAYIIETHTRNIKVDSGQIDPNRMFSNVGAEASLKNLNPDWDAEHVRAASSLLDRDRGKLIHAFLPPPEGRLVALHNNSEGYSVNDELPISDAQSIREPSNPHAFFLCTDPDDFRLLSASGYNTVLQQHKPKEDDGSLSRLAAARGRRYVNVETAFGQSGRQTEMMDYLEWALP